MNKGEIPNFANVIEARLIKLVGNPLGCKVSVKKFEAIACLCWTTQASSAFTHLQFFSFLLVLRPGSVCCAAFGLVACNKASCEHAYDKPGLS